MSCLPNNLKSSRTSPREILEFLINEIRVLGRDYQKIENLFVISSEIPFLAISYKDFRENDKLVDEGLSKINVGNNFIIEIKWETEGNSEDIAKVLKNLPHNIQSRNQYELISVIGHNSRFYTNSIKTAEKWAIFEEFAANDNLTWLQYAWLAVSRNIRPILLFFKKKSDYNPTTQHITSMDFERLLRFVERRDENLRPSEQHLNRKSSDQHEYDYKNIQEESNKPREISQKYADYDKPKEVSQKYIDYQQIRDVSHKYNEYEISKEIPQRYSEYEKNRDVSQRFKEIEKPRDTASKNGEYAMDSSQKFSGYEKLKDIPLRYSEDYKSPSFRNQDFNKSQEIPPKYQEPKDDMSKLSDLTPVKSTTPIKNPNLDFSRDRFSQTGTVNFKNSSPMDSPRLRNQDSPRTYDSPSLQEKANNL